MCLPCHFHDKAHLHACVFVGTAEAVDNIEFLVRQLFLSQFLNGFPCLWRSTVVVVLVFVTCPPYRVVRIFIVNDEFVLRTATGIDTRHYVDSTQLGLLSLVETSQTFLRLFVEQHLVGRVVEHFRSTCDAILLQYFLVKLSHDFVFYAF